MNFKRIIGILVTFCIIFGVVSYLNRSIEAPSVASPDAAQELYSLRTPHVGDNSAVSHLLDACGFGTFGRYTFELQTAAHPYSIIIHYDKLNHPFAKIDFERPAVLLLGLVENADKVQVLYQEQRFALTTKGAGTVVGHDVKKFGQSEEALAQYLSQSKKDETA